MKDTLVLFLSLIGGGTLLIGGGIIAARVWRAVQAIEEIQKKRTDGGRKEDAQ